MAFSAQVEVGEVGDRKMITKFKQDAKVDDVERSEQANFMRERWKVQVYSEEEVRREFDVNLPTKLF